MTELAGPSRAKIDDPLRRCQFSPPAVMAALLNLESAGCIGTLPGNYVALLTDEAHWTA
jgi:DNA processing protein